MRIPVLAEDNSVRFWMKYNDALDGLRLKKIEEIHDRSGKFIGVVLCESRPEVHEEFHRGSLHSSPTSITKSESIANAGLAPKKRVVIAREKVTAWPDAHDDNSVVISAGVPIGVFCPVFGHPAATEVHSPNFS